MKALIYLLALLMLFAIILNAQEKDSLIQLYPGMDDTLDFIDREIFRLYTDIDGFQDAQLFVRNDKNFVSKINYKDEGLLKRKILVESISAFHDLKNRMSQFKIENDHKYELPLPTSVFTRSGSQFDGRLKMFSKIYLYVNSDTEYGENERSPIKFKVAFSKIDSLSIPVKQSTGKYLLYGVGGGTILGFIIGYATFDDDWGLPKESKWLISGAIGAGIGFLFGWLIGESLPPNILTITFNYPTDILKLKEYSAYYYQKNRSIEEQYVEMK